MGIRNPTNVVEYQSEQVSEQVSGQVSEQVLQYRK